MVSPWGGCRSWLLAFEVQERYPLHVSFRLLFALFMIHVIFISSVDFPCKKQMQLYKLGKFGRPPWPSACLRFLCLLLP